MSWDNAGERPRSGRRPLLLLAGLALVLLAAWAAGSGEATERRDPEVLDVRTAQPEDLELPAAPGAGTSVDTETEPPDEPTSREMPPTDGAVASEAGLIVPGGDALAIVSLGDRGSSSSGGIELQRLDLATGRRRTAPVTSTGLVGLWPQIAPIGDDFVVVVGGRVVSYDEALREGATLAEQAGGVLGAPGAEGVWVIGNEPPSTTAGTTRLVNADGAVMLTVHLPGHVRPAAATERGLVLEAGGVVSVLESDGNIVSFANGDLLAVSDRYVATIECVDGINCGVVVRDIAGEVFHSHPVPETLLDVQHFLPQAMSLSPDGSLLAYPAQGPQQGGFDLSIFNVAEGAPVDVPEGLLDSPYRQVEWAPVGRRLLVLADPAVPRWWDLDTDEITSLTGSGNLFSAEIIQDGR